MPTQQHEVPRLCQGPRQEQILSDNIQGELLRGKMKSQRGRAFLYPHSWLKVFQTENRFWPCLPIKAQLRKYATFPTCPFGILSSALHWRSKPALNTRQRRWGDAHGGLGENPSPIANQPQGPPAGWVSFTFITRALCSGASLHCLEYLIRKHILNTG